LSEEDTSSHTVDEIVGLLKKGISGSGRHDDSFSEIKAAQFRDFAMNDLESKSDHALTDALGNAKRAIECRVDELLYALCLHAKRCVSSS